MKIKTTFLTLFLLISLSLKSQTSDLLFIPNQNSFVATYKSDYFIGAYSGGYYILRVTPYTYTTPFTFINRFGLSIGNNRISFMGGVFFDDVIQNPYLPLRPDLWVKINPIRILLDEDLVLDLSLGLNYSSSINYGLGLSINY